MKFSAILICGIISLSLLASCIPNSTIPIRTINFEPSEPSRHGTLVVFLPGRGSGVASFEEHGFVQELQRRNPGIDMVGVEAHLGYYLDRTLPRRLKEDVITPAQKLGYRRIWLVGISMGGLGALLYDTTYPGDLTGICLLAPYLGDGSLLEEIGRSGGLARWQPVEANSDIEREIWVTLKAYLQSERSAGRVYLGFGTRDRFAAADRFFAGLLPTGQVLSVPGSHDWPTWRALWDLTLERAPLIGPISGLPQ
jgi:pimeloyl-ACP methyl ester carboxylesterase